jgi:hypothetical protein
MSKCRPILTVVLMVVLPLGCSAPRAADHPTTAVRDGHQWIPILDVAFSAANALDDWFLEGAANVSISEEYELLIENITKPIGDQEEVFRSTLWYRKPVWGDLRFEIEAKGEHRCGNIFFFNAQPLQGHKTIFEWARPKANYVDYTGDPRMRLYTLGILRAHQKTINFRFLGGELAYLADPSKADPSRSADPDDRFDAQTRAEFTRRTIHHTFASPYDQPDGYYRIVITAIANRIQVWVDGRPVMDYTDSNHAADPLRGGYFAFRNFATTKTWCRHLRVWRLSPQGL